jgi:peptidoglycan/LPS O-acetylase OafA/YrhL
MKQKSRVLVIILAVLYVILLPWPLYVFLPYMLFSGDAKIAAILAAFVIEFAIGIYLNIRQFKKMKSTEKTGTKVLFGVLALSFLIYAVSAIVYLVQVVSSYF